MTAATEMTNLIAADDLEALETLRAHFAPHNLLLKLRKGKPLSALQSDLWTSQWTDSEIETARALPPCRGLLYQPQASIGPEELRNVGKTDQSPLQKVLFREVRGKSVRITGPAGCGKSMLVKVISERLRRRLAAVVVEYIAPISSQPHTENLYGVLASFMHQVVSQRLAVLDPVGGLVARILKQRVWSERATHALLSSMLLHAENMDLLVVIYDMERWPASARSWWHTLQHRLLGSSKCTFLTSSRALDEDLGAGKPFHLDLSNEDGRKLDLIKARVRRHDEQSPGSAFEESVQKEIFAAAQKFQRSFTAVDNFLTRLFQSFTPTAPETARMAIWALPTTEEQLFQEELVPFFRPGQSRASSWVVPTLSWVLRAARPLHVMELAVAVLINLCSNTKQELQDKISADMERDLQSALGVLLSVKNQHAGESVKLGTHHLLTLHCLHYLGVVLADDSPREWKRCLSCVSTYRQVARAPRDPVLEFPHYACLFWPSHFLQYERHTKDNSDLVVKVAEFLQQPTVADGWFKLHLLCTGTASPASGDEKADSRKRAAQMAAYVGLDSVVAYLSGPLPLDFCLEIAVANDDHERVVQLMQLGQKDTTKHFPLHAAASAGSLMTMHTLLNMMEDEQQNHDGQTPLHLAAAGGHLDAVQFLLEKDNHRRSSDATKEKPGGEGGCVPSTVDAPDSNKQTPLMLAANMGHVGVARYLATSGAEVLTRDKHGKTALHHAVIHCPQVVELIARKEPIGLLVQDASGQTPLHIAARIAGAASASTMVEAASDSAHLGQLPQAVDESGRTALHCAAQSGAADVARILGEKDDNLRLTVVVEDSENQDTPAQLAALCGQLVVMKLILSWMPDTPDTPDGGLLFAASDAGQLLVVRHLLHIGCPPDGPWEEIRPLYLAAWQGHNAVVLALLQGGAQIAPPSTDERTSLHHASANGGSARLDREVMALLADRGADIQARSQARDTPLHLAAISSGQAVTFLLDKGAAVNDQDAEVGAPLHDAVRMKNIKSAMALIRGGADLDGRDERRKTPRAVRCSAAGVASFIKEFKDIIGEDNDRVADLFIVTARQTNLTDILVALVYLGADINQRGGRLNKTILHIAAERGRPVLLDPVEKTDRLIFEPARRGAIDISGSCDRRGRTCIDAPGDPKGDAAPGTAVRRGLDPAVSERIRTGRFYRVGLNFARP
ncbi:hypothetical protein GGTG_08306 [Gaeumannomyces tritici R3-111a-1]|uniref:Nephrocystin 3-like N-terminal domain-containing protein n=1 Tax=Gaeumannomyces tritici (strain R3-111a-1) TaxID=644352 RepID=J3P470_GAET3|nr:hypothetical protein GGTG_08306 [Gaeumannomyces tritici R3-111a-1]EJT74466.1 hypothetical protein GGTG_08306 [Gaeumannomyces tritici R3-111a-1]